MMKMQAAVVTEAPRTLDALSIGKAVACVLVVAQHTLAIHVAAFGHGWNLANIHDSFTRVAVPIFLMTSGAIFLERSDSYSYFYTRRLLRIAMPLVFWSIVYSAWISFNGGPPVNWLLAMLHGPVMYHLWYFYAIIGLSLVTPILAPWFQSTDLKARWALIATWFVFTAVLPLIGLFATPVYGTAFATGYSILDFSGYLVLGAVLRRRGQPIVSLRWCGLALYLLGTAGVAIATRMYSKSVGHPEDLFYYNNSLFVILAAAGIFLMFQHMNTPGRIGAAVLGLLSACSLGIYGIHPLIMALVFKVWSQLQLSPSGPPMSVLFMTALGASLAVIWALRLLTPLRKVM
jgi:surface polysaccharide O-acyltransferase-like enzyme